MWPVNIHPNFSEGKFWLSPNHQAPLLGAAVMTNHHKWPNSHNFTRFTFCYSLNSVYSLHFTIFWDFCIMLEVPARSTKQCMIFFNIYHRCIYYIGVYVCFSASAWPAQLSWCVDRQKLHSLLRLWLPTLENRGEITSILYVVVTRSRLVIVNSFGHTSNCTGRANH